jgi:hypothetical protein
MKTTTIAEYLSHISGVRDGKAANGTTYAAMAPKLVARTVFANRAFSVDTRRMRITIRARRTDLLVTNVKARTGSSCTTQRQTATTPNSAFLNFASENFV